MKISTRIAALALAAPVALGVVVGCDDRPAPYDAPEVEQTEEAEDCDAEDLLNLEDDCGFSDSTTTTKKKAKTTTKKKTTAKKK